MAPFGSGRASRLARSFEVPTRQSGFPVHPGAADRRLHAVRGHHHALGTRERGCRESRSGSQTAAKWSAASGTADFALIHKMWSFKRGVPKAKMLISQSREGGIVAHTAMAVGARRSSAAQRPRRATIKPKRGIEAMRDMARHIEGGGVMAMTPDGPRGPRMRVKRGPIVLAKIAGAPSAGGDLGDVEPHRVQRQLGQVSCCRCRSAKAY